ncbi:hypothetical protein EAI_00223 [Harpegnathos saltator]|uniref:Uncharacterized protein n=1 Tax=Harpegnathos saltator TaxID=610380 RepID=E2BP97_HARSA|nr:hypothetical protein EAI_00223 [Harpegnathos saltator]
MKTISSCDLFDRTDRDAAPIISIFSYESLHCDNSRQRKGTHDISGELNDNADGVINIVKQENHQETSDEAKVAKALPRAVGLRATNIRKTSISMPSKLDEMEVLRIDRQNGTASKFARAESDSSSSVTFSNSGSTPNGSPLLGSETEEEANDEDLVK